MLRVLVVEDDSDTALQLKKILERRFNASAKLAPDAKTAREMVRAERFDIITLDYMLPDGRGLDLLQEITSFDDWPRVIMVTGHGDEETASRSFTSRASGYVVKDARIVDTLPAAVEKAVMELDLRDAQEALRQSEEHFRSLIENALDIVAVIDAEGRITYASPSLKRALGYMPSDLVGESALGIIHPDDADAFMSTLRYTLSEPATAISDEFRLRHSTGTWRYFEWDARRLPAGGKKEEVVVNARDTTRRKAAEEALLEHSDQLERLVEERTGELTETNTRLKAEVAERRKAQEELGERAERLRHFLTVASHELRHPVSVVKGYTSMLSGYMDRMSPEELPPILGAIDASINRLTLYIDDLLDVSRIENGRFQVLKQEVDALSLVNGSIEDMKARGIARDFVVSGCGAVTIRADHQKLSKLMVILLDNATKFSPDGTPIDVEVDVSDPGVVFSVMDRGPGVPAELEEKIFGRFVQAEDVQHHSKPGLGLGLYIAKEIAGAHGGDIWYEAREGGGSIFRFSIT